MSPPSALLFVGHDASRTGAPIAALTWLRWLGRQRSPAIEVHLGAGGPLVGAFAAIAPTRVRGRAGRLVDAGVHTSAAGPIGRSVAAAAQPRHRLGDGTVVVAGSLASWESAARVRPRRRLVCWVHELDGLAARILGDDDRRRRLVAQTDGFVAVGRRVESMLVDRWGVPAHQVTVIDSFVDPPAVGVPAPSGGNDLLGVGSLVPRKGADAFVAVAACIAAHRPVRGAWVGGPTEGPYGDLVRADLASCDLDRAVTLAGEVDDLEPWWPGAGVVVHVAREDPAPLAVLEAALRGVAVVTWDTGGAADLLRDAGHPELVASAGDLVAVAGAARALLDDEALRRRVGEDLAVAAGRRTTAALAPALLAAVLGSPA